MLRRRRFNVVEEVDRDYVEFIIRSLDSLIREHGKTLAKKQVSVPADLEADVRAKIIAESLLYKKYREGRNAKVT